VVHCVECVSCISLVHPVLDLGEQIQYWGVYVLLLLHHLIIYIQLQRGDFAIGIKEELDHRSGSDSGETADVVLQGLEETGISDRLNALLFYRLVQIVGGGVFVCPSLV
jgi:hypothetical protein